MSSPSEDDVVMASSPPTAPPALPEGTKEPTHGGYSRFELELEFVQCLGNPRYLTHLAAQKHLSDPAFVAYLSYLRYWSRPPYVKYLTYPGPTLKALQLLQSERFRRDIIHPTLADQLMAEGMRAAVEWHVEKPPPALRGQQQQQGQQQVGSTAGPAAGPGGS